MPDQDTSAEENRAETTSTADDEAQEMSPEQLAEAKRYGRQELVCGLADQGLDLVYLGLMGLVFARPLDRWLAGYLAADTPRLVALFLIVIALHELVSFPLSWFSGHVLEHRYGLSRQSFRGWLTRHLKHYALAAALGLGMFTGLFWIIWLTGPWWWLVASAGFFVLSVVLSQIVPVVILPMFYKIERLDNRELLDRMERLSAGTGLSIEGVYRMQMSDETSKANAMLAGLGATRRVILGDTLLDRFTPDEIEVILAHEIGHHVHRHIYKMIVAGIFYSAAGFWVCDRVLAAWIRHNGPGAEGQPYPPVYALPLLMFVLTAFFMLLGPLQNFVSRRYERQCDRYALRRTGLKQAYLSAFRKLARLNKDDPDPHAAEVFLFHSHPPIAERLALADE